MFWPFRRKSEDKRRPKPIPGYIYNRGLAEKVLAFLDYPDWMLLPDLHTIQLDIQQNKLNIDVNAYSGITICWDGNLISSDIEPSLLEKIEEKAQVIVNKLTKEHWHAKDVKHALLIQKVLNEMEKEE
jgi:hypothetical protein